MPEAPTETRTYIGSTSGPGGFDGYAGLVLGKEYPGQEQHVLVPSKEEGADPVPVLRVVIDLGNGRTTNVTPEQWGKWFRK
jgi:hypothetical protein